MNPQNEGTPTSMVLVATIEIPGRLPSWNDLLGMEHWERYRLKEKLAKNFLFALRQSASDSSTKTTSARNIMSTAADTLASYQQMTRLKRELKSAKKKLAPPKQSTPASKSLKLPLKLKKNPS